MWSRTSRLRAMVSAFLALAFFVAVMPGTMAMPAPVKAPAMAVMTGMGCCDDQQPAQKQDTPCKGMKLCLGLLSCFGVAAIAADHPVHFAVAPEAAIATAVPSGVSLSHPPDTPPPIA